MAMAVDQFIIELGLFPVMEKILFQGESCGRGQMSWRYPPFLVFSAQYGRRLPTVCFDLPALGKKIRDGLPQRVRGTLSQCLVDPMLAWETKEGEE